MGVSVRRASSSRLISELGRRGWWLATRNSLRRCSRSRYRRWAIRESGKLEAVQRVAIVGSGGAGKSTSARALGEVTDLPVVHLDRFFWKPDWVETPRDEWRQRQSELSAGDRWIADGNYGGTFDDRFSRADTVIIVARSRLACIASAVGRSARNHGKPVQAEGCTAGIVSGRLVRCRALAMPAIRPVPMPRFGRGASARPAGVWRTTSTRASMGG